MIERDTSEVLNSELETALRERLTIVIECELEALELIGVVDDEPELPRGEDE